MNSADCVYDVLFDHNVLIGPRITGDIKIPSRTALTPLGNDRMQLTGTYSAWATIAEFEVPRDQRRPGWLDFEIDVDVAEGSVGLLVIDADGKPLSSTVPIEARGRHTTPLQLGLSGVPASVVLRNRGRSGVCTLVVDPVRFRDRESDAVSSHGRRVTSVSRADSAVCRGRYEAWSNIASVSVPHLLRRPGLFEFEAEIVSGGGAIGYLVVDENQKPLAAPSLVSGAGTHRINMNFPVTSAPASVVFCNWSEAGVREVKFVSASFKDTDTAMWVSDETARLNRPRGQVRLEGHYKKWNYIALLNVPRALRRAGSLEFAANLNLLRGQIGYAVLDGEQRLLSRYERISDLGPHSIKALFECDGAPAYVVIANWEAEGDAAFELSSTQFTDGTAEGMT